MRILPLVAAITISLSSISALAQEALIEFTDGEVASAEDINSNFQNLNTRLNAIEQFGGCSATQDGSSVVITCVDGTSGVLASAGTVVVYTEGMSPILDLSTLKTGDLVLVDANDQLLAPLRSGQNGTYLVELPVTGGGYVLANISNDEAMNRVILDCYSCTTKIYYAEQNCSGQAFVTNSSYLLKDPESNWLARSAQTQTIPQVTLSIWDSEACTNVEYANQNVRTIFPYTPSDEITNAAYPVRASQLP